MKIQSSGVDAVVWLVAGVVVGHILTLGILFGGWG